jgi:predicted nucleic acid-binding protein
MKRVYIETSIASYLSARPSRDLVANAWQRVTEQWWQHKRVHYHLFTSELALQEAGRGDADAATRRLACLKSIPTLLITDEVVALGRRLLSKRALPHKAIDDALHISVASVHGMDYLLTWNCRHIDNAELKPVFRDICQSAGYRMAEICTPQSLMGE